MSFFAGFSGRFGEELARSRSEEADRAERQSALESSILQHLSTSTDQEIASHAITGLLDLAGPQRKAPGLSGWLGKVAAHPALPTIRDLIARGRQVEDQPPQAPRMNVEEGLRAMPGAATGSPAVGGPPTPRPQMGPPSPDDPEALPSAMVPPPSAPFASGFKPATTKTVPRKLFSTPAELEAEKETATLMARGAAYDKFAGMPGKQSLIPGVNNPPAPHPLGEWRDEKGEVGPVGQWYKQELVTDANGVRTITRTPISKTTPRPTGPEGQALERAREIQATIAGLTDEQALEMARAEGRAATLAKVQATADAHQVRLGQIQAMIPATLSAWLRRTQLEQQVTGNVPMTQAQASQEAFRALSASRLTLGGGPDVTVGDIERMAKGLLEASRGRRGAVVSPIRADMTQPLGGPPAPAPTPAGPPPSPVDLGIPPDLADLQRNPRQFTAGQQDQRTTMRQILTLAKEIETEGATLGWAGVGGVRSGSISQFFDTNFGGVGDPAYQAQVAAKTSLRNKLNHIYAILANLQGGQQLTAYEIKIVQGFAPTIDQSVPVLTQNLTDLQKFLQQKLALQEQNVERPGKGRGGATTPPPAAGPAPPIATEELFIGPDGKTYVKLGMNPDGSIRFRLKGGG